MKKLLVLPLMLSLISIIGGTPVEAKRNRLGGRPGASPEAPVVRRPRKCNLCQPKPPKRCNLCQSGRRFNFGTPMPRGGFQPNPGTQWR